MRGVLQCAPGYVLVLCLLSLAACGEQPPTTPSGVRPVIATLSPATPQPTDGPQTLTFSGTGFSAGLRVLVTAPDGSAFDVQGAAISAVQPATFDASVVLAQTGIYSFVVRNVNGLSSPVFTAIVQPPGSARPVIYSVTPTSVPRNTTAATVVALQGANFGSGASVLVTDPNGMAMALTATLLTLQSDTRIEFRLTFGIRGTYTMVVTTSSGETSNPVFLAVG